MPSTYTSYNRTISQYIAPRIGHVLLSKLTAAHVESLYSALRNDDKKPITGKSLQLVHIVLHAALKRAVRQGRIVRNACAMVDRPRYQPAPRQPLNAEQVRRLLEMANDNRLEALYVLAVFTGVRQGEALGLQWSDIEWQARTASIRRSLQELEDGTVVALEPKTEKSRRCIDLAEPVIAALRRHQARMLAEGHRAVEWVFCDTNGKPLRKSNFIRRSFHPLRKAAGLPETLHFHDLRHTAATLMLLNQESPKVVQEMLGHSSIGITMDTYSHVMPGLQRGAVDRLAALVSTGTEGSNKS